MSHQCAGESSNTSRNLENQSENTGVKLIVLNLPEDEGEGLGFRLTRTLWDPYPWVREVTPGSRADAAGLKTGDCLLQADGRDLLGLPVGQVAGLIRGDGAGGGVSLLVWNCGVDPKEDPELLWSCGGGSRGERSRRALSGVLRALSCCVCAATATRALHCARSHLYCEACWSRLERCALCREPLPPKNSPYSRNLVAEQVFEAIATEYEIKTAIRHSTETASASCSPTRSPTISPAIHRKGQYQLSMMNKRKTEITEKYRQIYSSDPNIHNLSSTRQNRNLPGISRAGNTKCSCQNRKFDKDVQTSNVSESSTDAIAAQHRLVTRLRQACSLADLQNSAANGRLSTSLNNLGEQSKEPSHYSSSLDNLKSRTGLDSPVFLVSPPPVYVVTCTHQCEEKSQ